MIDLKGLIKHTTPDGMVYYFNSHCAEKLGALSEASMYDKIRRADIVISDQQLIKSRYHLEDLLDALIKNPH